MGVVAAGWPATTPAASPSPVDGTWMIQDLILNLFDCDSRVCGRIVWIRDPNRRPSQCGMTIVWGLGPTGKDEWSGGSILDPDKDITYRLSASLEPDGDIRARIYKGVPLLGQTKILRRVDLNAFSGKC